MSVPKTDLIDARLMVQADRPPKSTNMPGIFEVQVFLTKDSSQTYRVLCTNKDIDEMVRAYNEMKPFTFIETDDKYPQVKICEAEKIKPKEKQEDLDCD